MRLKHTFWTFVLILASGVVLSANATVAQAASRGVATGTVPARATAAPLPSGRAAATASPLYTERFGQVNCPAGSPTPRSSRSYRIFLTRVHGCLLKGWKGVFKSAGLKLSTSRLAIVTKRRGTPCGAFPSRFTGFYCSADRTIRIYLHKDPIKNGYGLWGAELLAHEFGHHIQEQVGIMKYSGSATAHASRARALELSRRLELQAQCFAGVFLSSVSRSVPGISDYWADELYWWKKNGADSGGGPRDHGTGPNNAYWLDRGFDSANLSACNTWTAPKRTVA